MAQGKERRVRVAELQGAVRFTPCGHSHGPAPASFLHTLWSAGAWRWPENEIR